VLTRHTPCLQLLFRTNQGKRSPEGTCSCTAPAAAGTAAAAAAADAVAAAASAAAARLKWRSKDPLTLLELRTWVLQQPLQLPAREQYFG
jgi:hypothetical protein